MTMLFDKLDIPDFEDLSAEEAWVACEEWEDWMYSHLSGSFEFSWDDAIRTNQDNYTRYYAEYENE